jgi:hypothetical protein
MLSRYVELGPRLYEVIAAWGPIVTRNGTEVLWLVDHEKQSIFIDAREPESEQVALLNEAINAGLPIGWRQVPVVGVVS